MFRRDFGERWRAGLLWAILASCFFGVAGLAIVAGDLGQIGGPWPYAALAVAGIALGLTVARAALLLYAGSCWSRRLEDDNEKLRATVDSAVDGIVVIDGEGRIEEFNSAAEEMFGYRRGEVIGNNVSVLMAEPYRRKHDYIGRYLETGEARIIGRGRTVEALRRDGTIFPVDLAVTEARVHGRRFFTGILRSPSAGGWPPASSCRHRPGCS